MTSDFIRLADSGWQIISQAPESREAARRLLYWLTDALELRGVGIHFENPRSSYSWEEQAGCDRLKGALSKRPFPESPSYWFFEQDAIIQRFFPLLDLLARQWMHLASRQIPTATRLIVDSIRFEAVEPSWVAVSRLSRQTLKRIQQLSGSLSPLLIMGESGTGRSHLARLIHAKGPQANQPFTLENSEKKDEGTLYLPDWEIRSGDEQKLPLAGNKRLIVAINTYSKEQENQAVAKWNTLTAGKGETLKVPALRERSEDIPLLAGYVLEQLAIENSRPTPELSQTALEALCNYRWPGNVRELQECLTRSASKDVYGPINATDLPPAIRSVSHGTPISSLAARITALESEALKEELSQQHGNMTQTAKALGLTPRQVSWKLKRYGIAPQDYKRTQLSPN